MHDFDARQNAKDIKILGKATKRQPKQILF